MFQSAQERIASRQYSFPERFTEKIEGELNEIGFSLKSPGDLSRAILKLSTHYIENAEAVTPWHQKWAQAAYLAYFFPLNWARSQAVVDEAARVDFFSDLKRFIDFGSGVSAYSSLLEPLGPGVCIEISEDARRLHQKFTSIDNLEFHPRVRLIENPKETLSIFSYVLTELPSIPSWALETEALLIVEPSTREDGRRLQGLRQDLIDKGFYPWAPCTHMGFCPLVTHTKTDWCHDRILFKAPDWFVGLEKLLPMKNRTITFSYMLMRKSKPRQKPEGLARLVGDELVEKGKTRQLVCRGEEREFLSWLHRDGPSPSLKRGSLVQLPPSMEKKGNELRSGPDWVSWLWSGKNP